MNTGIKFLVLAALPVAVAINSGFGDSTLSDSLDVKAEVIPNGSHFVGQGFELRVSTNAADQRPDIEVPRIVGAEFAIVSTTFRPLSTSEIGSFVSGQNRFITRLRVVPRRVGILEIPALRASVGGRSGRSHPLRVKILPVPPEGRPPEFLGGIGNFSLHASVSQNAARVGQEFEFRIAVNGPAAVGMTALPSLDRFAQLSIAPTIHPLPDEATIEPLARTFRYRIRPTQAGEIVLPPVKITAFDPISRRYLSQVTQGIPFRVVDVPAFDASTMESVTPAPMTRQNDGKWAVILVCGAVAAVAFVLYAGMKRFSIARGRPMDLARRFAVLFAHELKVLGRASASAANRKLADIDGLPGFERIPADVAEQITGGLIRYLELAIDRPPGAITPAEARQAITCCTNSETLGNQAEQLVTMCDAFRFRLESKLLESDVQSMIGIARTLFRKLSQRRFGHMNPQARKDKKADDPFSAWLSRATETPRY